MADITMCSGVGCPMRDTCYRYTAPVGMRQSYFMEPPIRQKVDGYDCSHYWKTKEKKDGGV